MRIRFLLILIYLIIQGNIFASNDYSVEQINFSEDLPVSDISKIYFGGRGLLWIGTNKGLYYFDGYKYSSLVSYFFSNNTLSDDNILDIAQDPQGDIWLLTHYGIEKYNVSSKQPISILELENAESVKNIIFHTQSSSLIISFEEYILRLENTTRIVDTVYKGEDIINSLPIISDNKLYFTKKGELIEIDVQNQEESIIPFNRLSQEKTSIIKEYNKGGLIIAVDKSLYHYDISNKKFKFLIELPSHILKLSDYKDGKYIVAAVNKVLLLDLGKLSTPNISLLKTFYETSIESLTIDDNGFAWVATNKTIFKINPYSKVFNYNTFLNGYINYPIDDYLVFESTKSGVVFKSSDGKFKFYHSLEKRYYDLPITECTAACLHEQELFIGESDRVLKYNLKNKKETEISDEMAINAIKSIDDNLWIASNKGLFLFEENEFILLCDYNVLDFLVKDEVFYIITEKGFGKLDKNSCSFELLIPDKSLGAQSKLNDILQSFDNKTWIATDNGLFQFRPDSTKAFEEQFQLHYDGAVYALIEAAELPEVWYSTDIGIGAINYQDGTDLFFGHIDGVMQTPYLLKGAYLDENLQINFVTGKQVLRFNPQRVYRRNTPPDVIISKAIFIGDHQTKERPFYDLDTLIVLPTIRHFELELTTFDYFSPLSTSYQYSLEPIGDVRKWRKVQNINKISIGRLSPGKYELFITAKNSHGVESNKPRRLIVIVKAPLLQTKLAYFGYFIILILMVVLLIRVRTRNLRRINREYKEKERIAKEIEIQKEQLTLKNKNITDSINYARRIQLAMMPSVKLFSSIFPDSFVLHIPKDIVSGDFYWVNQVGKKTFFSAVDCTGHGVPGAFMSIIGVELFRRITEIEGISTPAEVLNSLSRNFERVFGDVDEMKLRDGMDLAFCSLNEEGTVLEFAGAFNPLYIIRDSSIMEIKGDRHSVGVYEEEDEVRSFNNHRISLQDGDTIYIFTDGFADQFGGPEGKKYKYRRFRHLLLALHQLPMDKQKEFLRKSILEWKGDLDQVDDILVMGIRINH